ncbi:hypothetical protein DERF_011190 [Dermatophagoides farinae]|uniref:Uncharacterized protein n=1 Tax=Dermatophagoides farinae TaxID=6954 RepID=A0A922HUG9_DERFA|nr:hypothetical protein DERF_011190 [Dermatophagoides farinae]
MNGCQFLLITDVDLFTGSFVSIVIAVVVVVDGDRDGDDVFVVDFSFDFLWVLLSSSLDPPTPPPPPPRPSQSDLERTFDCCFCACFVLFNNESNAVLCGRIDLDSCVCVVDKSSSNPSSKNRTDLRCRGDVVLDDNGNRSSLLSFEPSKSSRNERDDEPDADLGRDAIQKFLKDWLWFRILRCLVNFQFSIKSNNNAFNSRASYVTVFLPGCNVSNSNGASTMALTFWPYCSHIDKNCIHSCSTESLITITCLARFSNIARKQRFA